MSDQTPSDAEPIRKKSWVKSLVWNLVRVGVTCALIGYVASQITWKDRLLLPTGEAFWGWAKKTPQGWVFVDEQARTFRAALDDKDANAEGILIPGFITLFRQVRIPQLMLSFLGFQLGVLLLARRWQWLLESHSIFLGFVDAVRLTWIGMFASNLLPGSTGGDVAKAICVSRRSPGKRTAAVMTVFIDRVLGLVSLMIVAAVAIVVQQNRPELRRPAQFVIWVLGIAVVGSCLFFSGRLRRWIRLDWFLSKLPHKVQTPVRALDESVFHFRNHIGTLIWCVAISILLHAWTITCIYGLGRSLRIPTSISNYFVFLPVIFTVGAVAPSISGLGVMEGLFQFYFSGVGATTSSAVALCILYRIASLCASLPGALPAWRELREKPRHATKTIAAPNAEPSLAAADRTALQAAAC